MVVAEIRYLETNNKEVSKKPKSSPTKFVERFRNLMIFSDWRGTKKGKMTPKWNFVDLENLFWKRK